MARGKKAEEAEVEDFTAVSEPAQQGEAYDKEAASAALAAAIEADDAARAEWAENGGDRIGDPPDPSVNEPGPDITSASGDSGEPEAEPEAEPA